MERIKNNLGKASKRMIALIAGLSVSIVALVSGSIVLSKLTKKKNVETNTKPTATTSAYSGKNLGDLGSDNIKLTKTTAYVVVNGDFNAEDVVADENGKLYVNEEAKENAKNVGKTSIDLKNGTLETKKNPDTGKVEVYEKENGYVVKGNGTTQTGNGKPTGYKYDSNLDMTIEEDEVGKNVKLDKTYYFADGTVFATAGEVFTKEAYQKLQDYVKKGLVYDHKIATTKGNVVNATTTKATVATTKATVATTKTTVKTTTPTTKVQISYYEIYDMKFESKADYDQWVLNGYTGYAEADGIMMSIDKINEYNAKSR